MSMLLERIPRLWFRSAAGLAVLGILFPVHPLITDDDHYDFIIVGGGYLFPFFNLFI